MLIYVIEDDESIRDLIKIALEGNGFDVCAFETAEEGLAKIEKDKPALALLDIMLPGISGIEALRLLRNSKSKALKRLPVIMLTAKDSERDKISGLDTGADDYITKPFSILELMARVRALIRRTEETKKAENEIKLGTITIKVDSREVFADGELVALTFKEYELLLYLIKNENRVISRDELLREIWGYDYTGETRTIDIQVRTTRQKLKQAGSYIKTIRGMGYKASEDSV
ncbi:MAG: response regulator transcription factor [Clostridiales bacterium]|nr:response regulator transcription factor [Clostridiales bacterium]